MWEWDVIRPWLPVAVWALVIPLALWWGHRQRRGTIVCPYCGGPGRVRLVGDGRLCACCQIRPGAPSTEKGPHKICDQCLVYGFSLFREGIRTAQTLPPAPAPSASLGASSARREDDADGL
jgi:hypothetical protein